MAQRLEKFLALCNQGNAEGATTEYIKAGGNVLEILKSLDTSEKKNINTVFSAMQSVILKILSSFPDKLSSAEEACRCLINSHLSSIHSMLSSQSAARDRRIVLKLLAAVVSLGKTFPRELLNHLSLHQELVEALTAHSKPTDRQSVRTCFIYFLLSFLPEGNYQDVRALLEKRGVFSSIFSGLIYDHPDLVQLVLTTARQHILENSKITKTTKLHVFSTPVIKSIVQLYNWKGPNNWKKHVKELSAENVDPSQKEAVVDAVHEFLIILLTSSKYGIVFQDKSLGTDSSRKYNELIDTILQSLERPWEHKKPAELVVLILRACPDLIKSQFKYAEPYLAPRLSKNWFDIINFIGKIVTNIDEKSYLKLLSSEISINNLINAILNLTTPALVIKNSILPSLEHSSPLIRHGAVTLLLVMTQKVLNFRETFKKLLSNLEFSNFSSLLSDHILKNMPNFESMLNVWNKAFHLESEEENLDAKDISLSFDLKNHLMAILNLLEAYSIICPEILATPSVENMKNIPTSLITDLSNLQNINKEEFITIKVKAIKILLHSNLHGFSPNEEIFSSAMSFLLTAYGNDSIEHGNKDIFNLEVHQTIHLLLGSCGVFEGFHDEIDIWIEAFEFLEDFNQKLEISRWFVKIIKRVFKHTEKYVSLVHKTEKNTEEEMMDVNRLEDILNDLSEKNIDDVKLSITSLPVTSISLPAYAAIENLEKNSFDVLEYYISVVLSHIMHFQISTKALISLIEHLKIPAQDYLLLWKSENTPVFIKKPFKYHQLLISKNSITSEKCEKSAYKVDITNKVLIIQQGHNIVKIKLTSFYVKALVRMFTFYLLQFSQKNVMNENLAMYKNILLSLLNVAQEMGIDLIQDCARWIFRHQLFLQYFQGFYENEISSEKIITDLFIDICNSLVKFKLENFISPFLQPYQEKFIAQIKSNIKKYEYKIVRKDEKLQMAKSKVSSQAVLGKSPGIKRKREQNDEDQNVSLSSDQLKTKAKRQRTQALSDVSEKQNFSDLEKGEKMHIELISLLQLNCTSIKNIIIKVINLTEENFLSQDKSNLSIWGILIPELLKQFSFEKVKIETSSYNLITGNLLKKIFFQLIKLKSLFIQNLDTWENSLCEYLIQFSHNVSTIDEKIFTELLKTNLTPATIKLLVLLTKKNHKLISAFKQYTRNNEVILKKKSLIFSILSHNLNYEWGDDYLKKLYQFYKKEIILFTTDVKTGDEFSWIKDNIDAVTYLIDNQFDTGLCKEICNVILANETKLELVQEEHIILFIHLFNKSAEINPDALNNLFNILLHITVSTLKKSLNPNNVSKLKFLNEKLLAVIGNLKLKSNFTFREINEKVRKLFVRISLKTGLKVTKNVEKDASFLIKTLAEVCDIAFKDDGNDYYVKDIFDMIVPRKEEENEEFMKIILSNSKVKDYLLELLLILLKKDNSLMDTNLVPLFLTSYNATLTISDQLAFKIFQLYESSGVKLDNYWPYVWSNAAASHYNIESKIDTALWRQPTTSQILDLLIPEIVLNTIKNYPVYRNWRDEFSNTIDQKEIYDPIFYLPLFSGILCDNNFVACHKVIHSGALALAIISLSSMCKNVRFRAITVISRFHFHLEATTSKEKSLWINFLNVLRNGIIETELPLENVRLNGFVATFLARASLIMVQPGNPLYSPLHMFFMAKPALDLNTIPEFLQLFHSSEIQHNAHRNWILEVIRDGFKTESDMEIAVKCVLFKMLFAFYDCSLADKSSKSLILEIIRAATKLPKPCLILSNKYALIPWLNNTIHNNLNSKNVSLNVIFLEIVNNVLAAHCEESKLKKKKYHFYSSLINVRNSLERNSEAVRSNECK